MHQKARIYFLFSTVTQECFTTSVSKSKTVFDNQKNEITNQLGEPEWISCNLFLMYVSLRRRKKHPLWKHKLEYEFLFFHQIYVKLMWNQRIKFRHYFFENTPYLKHTPNRRNVRISISPYSVQMWEKADQENSEYRHFLRSVWLILQWG